MVRKIMVILFLFFFVPNVICAKSDDKNYLNEHFKKFDITSENIGLLSNFDLEMISNSDLQNTIKHVSYYKTKYIYSEFNGTKKLKQVVNEPISQLEYDKNSSNARSDLNNYYETTYKKITLVISQLYSNPNERFVLSTLEWKIMPSVRSYDVYAMKIANGYFISGSLTGSYNVTGTTYDSACAGALVLRENKNITSGWNYQSIPTVLHGTSFTGVGYTVKLRSNSAKCINDLGITMYDHVSTMNLKISGKMYVLSPASSTTVQASYQHAVQNLMYGNVYNKYTFGASGLGGFINFTNGYNSYFDAMGGISITF